MKNLLIALTLFFALTPKFLSACDTYSCTVWYYTNGGGVTSCYHAHTSENTCAYSESGAASAIKSKWESNCDPHFKCGCSVDINGCRKVGRFDIEEEPTQIDACGQQYDYCGSGFPSCCSGLYCKKDPGFEQGVCTK